MTSQIIMPQVCFNKNAHTFISVPHFIYQDDPYWPGQNDVTEELFFNIEYNPVLRYYDYQLFYVSQGEEVLGRICVSIWQAFNVRWNKARAFFSFFECIDDQGVADQLFEAAKRWARERGMNELWGPIAFNLEGPMGFLIEGFDKIPTYGLPYNPPYYEVLCERHGFRKEKDFLELTYPVESYCQNAANLMDQVKHLLGDPAFFIRSVSPEHFEADIKQIIYVQNQSIARHWGSGEMALEEMYQRYKDLYENVGPKELLVVVEHNLQIVGFTFFHQDYNQLLHADRLNYVGAPSRVRGNTIGILPEYQGAKIGTWLLIEIARKLQDFSFSDVQIGWIMEDNTSSLRMCHIFGGKIDKVFRVYSIKL